MNQLTKHTVLVVDDSIGWHITDLLSSDKDLRWGAARNGWRPGKGPNPEP